MKVNFLVVWEIKHQCIPEEKGDGKRLSLLVRSRAWLDGEHSSKFVKHPGAGGG